MKQAITALVAFAVVCSSVTTATELEAKFSMSGVAGTVTFEQASLGATVTITLNLTGLTGGGQLYDWDVHAFPVLYDTASPCDASAIGQVFGALTTQIQSDNAPVDVADLELMGVDSIAGRSLLITDGTTTICATIQGAAAMTTAHVVLRSPIAGTALLRQEASDSSADTSIYTNFFYVDDTQSSATLRWEVLGGSSDSPDHEKTVEEICDGAGSTVSDLETSHGPVGVGMTSGSQKMFVTDTNLALSGDDSILGQILALYDDQGNKVSCGYVAEMKPKQVVAEFNMKLVTGTITFAQDSPYDQTRVSVDFHGLDGQAETYHVHEYPVPPQMTTDDALCGEGSVSGHWNPFGVVIADSPAAGTGTDDEYEVGDLSGKHGIISGDDFAGDYTDFNLPLFGPNSIVGRSVVIHKSGGERMVCASIGYSGEVATGLVVFRYPMSGFMMFRQLEEDPLSDTSIYVDVAYSDGCLGTQNHNWHVHIEQVGEDYDASSDRCQSVLGHYNPFVDSATDNYATDCSPDAPYRCELGDLSAKVGKIDIPGQAGTKAGKYFYTDVHTPLAGAYSVLGRSVVFHAKDAGADRIGCANIYQVKTQQATASSWSSEPVTGYFKFQQNSAFDPTQIDIDVTGLDSLADGYHVHILPLPEGETEEPCSDASVKGHFNPFDIDYANDGTPADGSTVDEYEVGDISGKFESMLAQTEFQRSFSDPSLGLSGPQSILGRSMVIHKEGGDRWTCATVLPDLDPDNFLLEMTVELDSTVSGTVTLQQVRYADGRLGDTSILVDVNSDSEEMTTYWSVFMESLEEEDSCADVDSEYNPYDVDTVNNYTLSCSMSHQRHCSVGDLTMKHGSYVMGSGRNFYTDVNLDLVGDNAVIGRTLKFTETSSGDAMGCANILPSSTTGSLSYVKFNQLEDSYSSYHFRQTVAEYMGVDMWQVAASKPLASEEEGCQSITFWFVGPESSSLTEEFVSSAGSAGESGLGVYAPTTDCPLPDVSGSHRVSPGSSTLLLSILLCLAALCLTLDHHPSV